MIELRSEEISESLKQRGTEEERKFQEGSSICKHSAI